MEEVENRCRNFSDTMIGMHIRRTDNLASIGKALSSYSIRNWMRR